MENCNIYVRTSEESILVQEWLFKQGASWTAGLQSQINSIRHSEEVPTILSVFDNRIMYCGRWRLEKTKEALNNTMSEPYKSLPFIVPKVLEDLHKKERLQNLKNITL